MRYKDELHIASTAILLSVALAGISVIVPKESRVPTAKTTLEEAPETAAEAEAAAEETGFPIYTQESNYDTSEDYSQGDTSYDSGSYDYDTSGDTTGGDTTGGDTTGGDTTGGGTSEDGSDQITYPAEGSGDNGGIPDYTEDPSEDYGQEDDTWEDPSSDGGDTGAEGSDTSQQDMTVYE